MRSMVQNLTKCRVRVELQGGGGIGAVATPIVGLDGSILHVRVVHGGFGYKFHHKFAYY